MKIRTPNIDFISFNEGVCNIYSEDEEDNEVIKYKSVCFSEKVLGLRRYYTAKAAQSNVNRVIAVPLLSNIDNHDKIIIEKQVYSIELIQPKRETNPPSLDLTLKQLEMFRGE